MPSASVIAAIASASASTAMNSPVHWSPTHSATGAPELELPESKVLIIITGW